MSDDARRDTDVALAQGAAPGPTGGPEAVPDDAGAGAAGGVRGREDTVGLLVTAVVAALVGVGLWAAARSDTATAVVVVVATAQALTIGSWMTGLRVPGRVGGLVVCALAAAGADVLAVVRPTDQLGVLVPPLGLLVLAIFVAQLSRGVVRVRVVESVSDVAVLGIAVVALASVIVLQHRTIDPDSGAPTAAVPVVLVIAVALVVQAVVDVVAPVPRFDPTVERGLLGVLLAAAAGGVASYFVLHDAFGFGPQRGAFLGAALGVVVGLIAVGSSFVRHGVAPSAVDDHTVAAVVVEAVGTDLTEVADADARRSLAELAAEEVLVEVDAQTASDSPWFGRLQPVAACLWAFAICAPVGYLLTVALGG